VADAHEHIDGANAAFQRIIAGVIVAGLFLALVRWQDKRRIGLQPNPSRPVDVTGRGWWWIAINAIAGPTLGVSCMQLALRSTPTGIVLAIIATTPLAVIPLARIFEGEKPTLYSLTGSVVAVAGVVGLALNK
jgi:drug/metabolite transporter (DMT)-like permease